MISSPRVTLSEVEKIAAIRYHRTGLGYSEIARALTLEGFPRTEATIRKFLKKYEKTETLVLSRGRRRSILQETTVQVANFVSHEAICIKIKLHSNKNSFNKNSMVPHRGKQIISPNKYKFLCVLIVTHLKLIQKFYRSD